MNNTERPYVTVGGFVIADDGEILFVRSPKWRNLYTVPGGKVEPGETLEQAFIREVKEETGLDVTNVQFTILQNSIFSEEFYNPSHFVMHEFIAELAPGQQKNDVILNEEGDHYLWLSPQKAREYNLNKETYVLLDWYENHMSRTAKIGFKDLAVDCLIGIYPDEKAKSQPLLIDLNVEINVSKAASSDDIHQTIDYDRLASICRKIAAAKHYHLLESYAETVLNTVQENYCVNAIYIQVKKPKAIQGASAAFVEMEWRKKNDK